MFLTKLTDKEKKRIIAEYIDCQNYCEVARKHNITETSVRRIVKANKSVAKKVEEKKEQNTLDTLEYIMSLKEKKQRILNKLLNAIEEKATDTDNKIKQNTKDLATAYGIILDKDMKILELQRGSSANPQLAKVDELLAKITEEANNGTTK